jgi:F-type H+-transporting ATPase subunit epsilon
LSQFELQILTPEREFYKDTVDMVVLKTTDGERGILARHFPTITTVDVGTVKIKKSGSEFKALLTEGLMYVTGTKVTITVDSAEWPEEIDVKRAEESLKRSQQRVSDKQAQLNHIRAKASMNRALGRIKVSKMNSGLTEEQKAKLMLKD